MRPRAEDTAWVARFIVDQLERSAGPLRRDDLTDRVLTRAATDHGLVWERATAARRVREGLVALLEGERPVISAGGGFKLASRATAAERERAASICERIARKQWAKAHKIRRVSLPGEPADGELFPGARS